MDTPTRALANGVEIPRIGLGTWPMDDAEVATVVPRAIEIGYRLVDTAFNYGNEAGVGKGLRAAAIPREELFVTSKLNLSDHGVREAQDAFARSAEKLGLDYLDLLLIHWPNPAHGRYVQAYEGLLALLADGRIRALGLSNFKPAHIDRLIASTGVVPHLNQIELNPSLARNGPRAYHEDKGIVTQSWAPLGEGVNAVGLLGEPVILAIAERVGRTPAQVVLRWHMELGLVTIPKSSNAARLAENLDVFDFELGPDALAEIATLDRGEAAATDSDVDGH
jgi:2,5-diketo-D-gluconate reductase A